MSAKANTRKIDPVAGLKAAGFDVQAATDRPGWLQATRQGCAIIFRATGNDRIETFRSAGLILKGQIFRVLDRGFQKFLSDDQCEMPAIATALQQINSFDQDFKDAVGMPVLFNEALGALTAFTNLDRVERKI